MTRRHVFALSLLPLAVLAEENAADMAANRGRAWLVKLLLPQFDLLPEFDGARVIWLYHDNWLAARVLEKSHPVVSSKILAAIKARGVERSGKIEMIFREAALPFHRYELRDVKKEAGYRICTEVTRPELNEGWENYADLLFIAAVAERDPAKARGHFNAGMKMWDGRGFADAVVKAHGFYATYKLALALHAARIISIVPPESEAIRQRLLSMQQPVGGWITDYTPDGKPRGMANVETTSLAILGLTGGTK